MQVFSTFWPANVLRATAACLFSTSERQKVARACGVLHILTWKCASRHSRVPFLNIGTSKMAPTLAVFEHFHFQMRFAPQPRAIFQHPSFKNGSDTVSFWACSLPNVLRATAACHFSTSELQKWLRHCQFCDICTSKCASCHSPVPFFNIGTSKMAPTMRCFVHFDLQACFAPQRRAIFHLSARTATSAPAALARLLFRTSGTTNHWKNTAIRDVPNIFRTCTFFLVTLHACGSRFCWLDISTLLDTSTLLFKSAYCRKLDF